MIETIVKEMPMPIGDDEAKNLYRVDYKERPMRRWITFGVYESREVALFVAENIKNGHICI